VCIAHCVVGPADLCCNRTPFLVFDVLSEAAGAHCAMSYVCTDVFWWVGSKIWHKLPDQWRQQFRGCTICVEVWNLQEKNKICLLNILFEREIAYQWGNQAFFGALLANFLTTWQVICLGRGFPVHTFVCIFYCQVLFVFSLLSLLKLPPWMNCHCQHMFVILSPCYL